MDNTQTRHLHISALYKSFNYLPIYSLRSLSSLLIQIPFFIAAYEMLSHFTGLNGQPFLFIKDLGAPDALFFDMNLLPILMTIINFIAAIFMSAGGGYKERKQSFIIATFFLILLYTSPAGLVLYWTFNNLINCFRYFITWLKEVNLNEQINFLIKNLKNLLTNKDAITFLLFIVLYFFINLYSFGAYTRNYSHILIILLIAFYLVALIKTIDFAKNNFSKNKSFAIKFGLIVLLFIISFIAYQNEKVHYLTAIIFLLALYQSKEIKVYRLADFLKVSGLSVSAILFPALVYMKSNAVYFVGHDLLVYLITLILFAAIIPILAYSLNKSTLNSICNMSISFIISAMFLPLIRELVGYAGDLPIDFIVLFSIALFIVSLFDKNKKILTIFFLCAAIFSGFTNLSVSTSNEALDKADKPTTSIAQELIDLDMKDKASIYLFMHDSFPTETLARHLGLDYQEVKNIFDELGFKVYDVYSIGYYTDISMTSVFDIKDHRIDEDLIVKGLGRRIMSGDNFVNVLLTSKGYISAIAGEDDPSTYEDKIFALGLTGAKEKNQVLLAIMQGRLNTMLLKHRKSGSPALQVAEFAAQNAGRDKIFAWGAAGPDHSSLSLDLDAEKKKWSVKYANAIIEIKKEMNLALEKNPDAIIIVMSDHGPWMLGNPRKDYENVSDEQISKVHFRDKHGALMAIRFPDKKKAAKYDKDFYIIQDLFPIVLAYLYDDPLPLKYKIKNTAVRMRGHKFDKGLFYPNFYVN
jgi:hypothetical protein